MKQYNNTHTLPMSQNTPRRLWPTGALTKVFETLVEATSSTQLREWVSCSPYASLLIF